MLNYIYVNFSFVNFHYYEENKLTKKSFVFWSLSNTQKRPNNPKLQIWVYIDKTDCKNQDGRFKKPETWRIFIEAFEDSQYWQGT